jgi:hypothetical protein
MAFAKLVTKYTFAIRKKKVFFSSRKEAFKGACPSVVVVGGGCF